MERAITAICDYLNNYFEEAVYSGTFSIENNTLDCPFLQDGQYFRIVGSVFNDGVYIYPDHGLHDEEFSGSIWALAIPQSFIELTAEIQAFAEEKGNAPTAFTSESFGGYSYTRATDSGGAAADWRTVFRKRLSRWRKVW